MGVFDSIKNAIWGRKDEPALKGVARASLAPTPVAAPAPVSTPRTESVAASTTAAPPPAASPAPAAPPPTKAPTTGSVDVAAILEAAVKAKRQKLDWRKSIVDLMKALDLDSSLANRRALAAELSYSGDTKDTAKMNIWLHKALMQKLAENGGKVPAELTD
jgi:hypothetical protein